MAEYGGLNRYDWAGHWLFPSGSVPTNWSVSYPTVTAVDSAGWAFRPAELAACRSLTLVAAEPATPPCSSESGWLASPARTS